MGVSAAGCGNGGAIKSGGNVISMPDAMADAAPPVPPCAPPQGVSGSPADVDALVAYINALGAERAFPVELACVLESLDRPLGILASTSPFSLQATVDPNNPRFFLWASANLSMTVLPTGTGSNLLEVGYEVSETRSVKAEIAFPVVAPLPPTQPFDHLLEELNNGWTSCGVCHGHEVPASAPLPASARESDIFRPLQTQEVDLDFLRDQSTTCDAQREPQRCAMLTAIFAHGDLQPRWFSNNARTIYDP
jgi:hypothetical protein